MLINRRTQDISTMSSTTERSAPATRWCHCALTWWRPGRRLNSLALIEDPEIRFLLGRYAGELERFSSLQLAVVDQYKFLLEPFIAAHTDYAGIAWSGEAGGLVETPLST